MAPKVDDISKFCPICNKVWAIHINYEIAEHLNQAMINMEERINDRINAFGSN